ncbi:hypothetical protein J3B02_004157 [Coemansia erecta]|uniref:Uncharacterized protein n=1 Tax=Coemansia asiatica TaxID=1052880 RepID=A0A9W8CIF1_9FUNG|nr:hypothetical protein LPJ64_003831 [Coemansia asiatica]KAJ2847466.1 hypothetical protein J3B02_004157 [Coemansia erecta]KAJ2888165.1 hypothetical protein FB639_000821 [Coemansia asiatica]
MNLIKSALVFAFPLVTSAASTAPELSALSMVSGLDIAEASQVGRISMQRSPMSKLPPVRQPPPIPTATAQGYVDDYEPKASASPSTTSSSSYDYSFGVALSGYDGSITHYYVSYSDPYVSGAVGVGHTDPTPTPESKPVEGIVCDKNFPSLLSGLHLDLGLRLNLMLIGINACVAL